MRFVFYTAFIFSSLVSFSQNNEWLRGEWYGETNIQLTERATRIVCHLNIDSVNGNNFSGEITTSTAFDTNYQLKTRVNAEMISTGFTIINSSVAHQQNAPRNNWQVCNNCSTEKNMYLKGDKIYLEIITKNCSSFCDGILRFYKRLQDYDIPTQTYMQKIFPGNASDLKRNYNNSDTLVTNIDKKVMGDSSTLPDELKRSTQFVKKIVTHNPEITVGIYDDKQIDGDVVTVYHNRDTVAYRKKLTAEPIMYQLNADKEHTVHRFTMVAENVGTIPPNTAVLIVTTREQQYELKTESTMQQNAGIEIDYEP